jgi:hypothetical protein
VSDLEVHTAEKIGLHLRLELGDLTQTVQVTAEASLLNTQSADGGTVIDNARINELPMLGRSPFILARISPGVLVAGQINDTKPYNVAGQSFVSIGGGRRYNTEFQINGMPDVLPVGYFSGRVAYTRTVVMSDDAKSQLVDQVLKGYTWSYTVHFPGKILGVDRTANFIDKDTNTVTWVYSLIDLTKKPRTMKVVFTPRTYIDYTAIAIAGVVFVIFFFVTFRVMKKMR